MASQKKTLEEKVIALRELMNYATPEQVEQFRERLVMSWIYHDSALEGSVYNLHELGAAIHEQVVSDTSLIPVYDEIRRHKQAIDLIYSLAEKKRITLNQELLHKIHEVLVPEDAEKKTSARYRKDMPLHRTYFHEIVTPDKIASASRKLLSWLNSTETKRAIHVVRLAAKVQFQLLQIFPYTEGSGKVARLFTNLILLRQGYPPCIIHATDRQRYYDALKTSDLALSNLIMESLTAGVESATRFFSDPEQLGVQSA